MNLQRACSAANPLSTLPGIQAKLLDGPHHFGLDTSASKTDMHDGTVGITGVVDKARHIAPVDPIRTDKLCSMTVASAWQATKV